MRPSTIKIFLFTLFASMCLSVHATFFRHITTKDGLSHQEVMSVSQDMLGRIWIGTRNGVNIFDGSKVESYKMFQKRDSTYFYANNVKSIVEDSVGNVYMRSAYNCIKYHIRYNRFEILPLEKISCLYSHNGTVYVSSQGNIYKLTSDSEAPVMINTFSEGLITGMLVDSKGAIWFVTKKGVFLCKNGEVVLQKEIQNVHSLYESSDGSVWVTSLSKGLFRWTPDGNVFNYSIANYYERGLKEDCLRGIVEDKQGNMWIASLNGLYKYRIKEDRFEIYSPNKLYGELSDLSAHTLFLDRNENLWVGTFLGGVHAFSTSQNSFNYYPSRTENTGLSHPIVGEMVEGEKGEIWIGTEGGGLNCLDVRSHTFRKFSYVNSSGKVGRQQFMPQNNVKSLAYDSVNHCLYIGTNMDGLYSYDVKKNVFRQIPLASKKKTFGVNSMALNNNKLALSTDEQMFLYDTRTMTDSLFFSVHSSFYRYIDNIGDNKFLFVNNGLNVLDLNNHERYLNKLVLPHVIYFFKKTRSGNIFITTHGGGIYKWNMDNGKLESLNEEMKGIARFCYRIVETKSGNLIVTCDEGLCVLNGEGKLIKFMKIENSMALGSFTKDCGLYVASDSTIYVGSTNGLLTFKEKDVLAVQHSDELYFSELYMQGKRINSKDGSGVMDMSLPFVHTITIPHWHNRIDVHFSSKDNILNVSSRRFRYKLVDIEDKWSHQTGNVISYTNLPPGRYTLELQSDEVVLQSQNVYRLNIVVLPPWYATWWACIIWIGIIVMLVVVVLRVVRIKRQAKEAIMLERMEKDKINAVNEAKFQFFTNVSHEFKTPLTLIIGQIEQLLNGYKLPPVLYNKLLKIMRYSRQLGELVTELMEYRKFDRENFVLNVRKYPANEFFQDIFSDFKELAVRNHLDFKYEYIGDEVDVYIDKNQMSKVVTNLLLNAFKFTPENGLVMCKVWKDDSHIYFSVADTGKGISPEEKDKIFMRFYQEEDKQNVKMDIPGTGIGLALVKEIVELHHGNISVESMPGKGTEFVVTLLLGSAHFENILILPSEEDGEVLLDDTECEVECIATNMGKTLPTDLGRPVILIVEDNYDSLEILKSLFMPLYHVETARDGEEGLAKVRALQPDIVLTDWIMPKVSGTDMCSKIKNDIELSHIPVVLLTALNLPEQQMEAFLCGADEYVTKPFNSKILLARCNNIIRSKKLVYQKLAKQIQSDLSLCATNTLDKEFLDKVTAYIDENLATDGFSIDQLSVYVNMSRSLFYNKFKSLTGMTPNDYINSHRLKKAAVWLVKYKEKSINEISDELGFSTHNYFSTKFKDCYGLTPLQYRKKERKD